MLELGPARSLRPRLDPVAVKRAVETIRANGRAVSHRSLVVGGSTVQGRAALIRPSIPFHAVMTEKRIELGFQLLIKKLDEGNSTSESECA